MKHGEGPLPKTSFLLDKGNGRGNGYEGVLVTPFGKKYLHFQINNYETKNQN